MKIFGFQILPSPSKAEEDKTSTPTFAPPQTDDGAIQINTGSYFGASYVDLDGSNIRSEVELITRYRDMAIQPELDEAINDIVNEAIVVDDDGKSVEIRTDNLDQPSKIKKRIEEEFENVLKMLEFRELGHDIFRTWYIDGRLFYHVVVDETNPQNGIKEIRYIDPRRIRKYREIQRKKDPKTGIDVINKVKEYYIYNELGLLGGNYTNLGQKIAVDSVINVNSGLLDSKRKMVIGYLHKVIKPLNQLRMVEDATVIYRLARSPERRIFYIDVGNLPTVKAAQYIEDIMVKYRNKLVYDSSTGEIRDDRKFMSMMEDFFLPRREGSKGTEISTLPAAQNLGVINDVEYFERKLYKSLGIPFSRTQPQTGFSLGRSTEITRDELKFSKFIDRLRKKFSHLFDDLLRIQLVLKGVCTEEEWNTFKQDIFYDFLKDNNFNELKEEELNTGRIQLLGMYDPFVGKYVSKMWIRKNILRQSEDDIKQIDKEIETEGTENFMNAPRGFDGGTLPTDNYGNPVPGSDGIPPPEEDDKKKPQEKPKNNK